MKLFKRIFRTGRNKVFWPGGIAGGIRTLQTHTRGRMMPCSNTVLVLVLGLVHAFGVQVACAGLPSVLVVACDDDPPTAELTATGRFSAVDYFDARYATPSLATLVPYDAVLVYTNFYPDNAMLLGDVLADYVDAGGRVSISTYSFSTPFEMKGRIMASGYSPLANLGTNGNVSGNLMATIPDPIFDGIDLSSVSYFHNTNFAHPGIDAGATLLATDGSGINMIAVNSGRTVVGLNLFPGTDPGGNNTEFYRLLANSLTAGPLDNLRIEPVEGLISSGEEGGPFTPDCKTYALTNSGPNSLDWGATATEAWLNVTPGGGSLAGSASTTVDVCINANADILPTGVYTDTVTFTDVTLGTAQTRDVKLTVGLKRILAYVQHTDTFREYPNTMAAIDSVCPNYMLTELTDYTQLSSMLPGHDVLLIPEQEKTGSSELEAIGAAWAVTLQEFVHSGGVVIQCDYGNKYGILTGAGLMDITSSGGCSGTLVNVAAPDDPVAIGVSSSYSALSQSSYYHTDETTVVVERAGYGPVVINKRIGVGHVVLIGHDYYDRNSDQDRIVGNAVCRLPLILDDLMVTPSEGFYSSGDEGGHPRPFEPPGKDYALRNIGPNSLDWNVDTNAPWLSADPCRGTLPPDNNTTVTVSIHEHVNDLDPNTYSGKVAFTNLTSGFVQTRDVTLDVNRVPGDIEVLDSIPPVNDLNVPFGDVIVGVSRTEQLTIANTDPNHELTVAHISPFQPQFVAFYEEFPTTALNAENWTGTIGAPTIDNVGLGEPSQPYSLRLNGYPTGGDAVESRVLDLSRLSSAELTYWYQRRGQGESPEPGEDLLFEYMNASGYWTEIPETRQYGSGPDMTYYEKVTGPLPPEALHTGFRLRVRSIGSSGGVYDDWFVDDVSITIGGDGGTPVTTHFRLENVPNLPATIEPLDSIDVNVVFEPNAVGQYEYVLVVRSDDRDEPEVGLLLTGAGILDFLEVIADANFAFSGHLGGPFVPTYAEYHLTNNGPNTIAWATEPNVPWLDADPNSGTLNSGESISVWVQANPHADLLPVGYYCADVSFTNVTSTAQQVRSVCLSVYTEPKIWADPHSFNVTVSQGSTQTQILTVGNTGGAILNFALSSSQVTPEQQSGQSPAGGSAVDANDDSVVFAPPGYDFTALADGTFAAGQLLVRFAPHTDNTWPDITEKKAILTGIGGAVVEREYKTVPGLCLVKLTDGMPMADALVSFNQTDGILYAQPDRRVKLDSGQQYIPNDPSFSLQWNMHNTGQTGGTADADIDAPEAWDIATGSGDIIVAVIDTGVDYTHPDLAANMWVNELELNGSPGVDDDGNFYVDDIYGWDFCTYGQSRDSDPMDNHGHGSHCAGIIGAVSNDAVGVAGTCWNVKIMAVKFLNSSGNGWTSDAIDCVEYSALMGADLMSNSWGGGPDDYDQALKDAIISAGQYGMLFVASAGNGYGQNNDVVPHYPSSYDCDNVIGVLSTDYDDQWSAHSNYGPISVDIGAPGGDSGCKVYSSWKDGGYYYAYGTSMAAPHVSGACALIWSVCPSLPHLAVKDIVMQTADPLPALAGLCVSGGRLNLHNAVLEAVTSCTAPWIEFIPSAGMVAPGETSDVNVVFNADCSGGTYDAHITISSDDPYVPEIFIPVTMTVEPVDYFTELFDPSLPVEPNDPNCNDMDSRTLMFAPYPSGSYYRLCTSAASAFPVDPNGGTVVSLNDDDYVAVNLQGAGVNFYGESYNSFYIGSNGYISFGSGDIRHLEGLADHFDLPRISVLFDDLDPSAGGTISWKQLDDRVVVTFENVPEYSFSNANSFQVEMLFDGRIGITLLEIATQDGLFGLSDGGGLSPYFAQSDLSEYSSCVGDLDCDTDVDLADYAVFSAYWQKRGNMETVRDEFNGVTYGGNKGTQNWSNNWQELGELDGPGSGFLQVVSDGAMRLGHENEKDQPALSLTREADLTGATVATLTYDYVAQNNGNAGSVSVQVSGNGGSNWTTLNTYSYDAGAGSASFDITPYISSNTQIRFEIDSMTKIKMYLYVDNIQIEYDDPEHPWHPWCNGADLNQDFSVDWEDLQILLEHYLQ